MARKYHTLTITDDMILVHIIDSKIQSHIENVNAINIVNLIIEQYGLELPSMITLKIPKKNYVEYFYTLLDFFKFISLYLPDILNTNTTFITISFKV